MRRVVSLSIDSELHSALQHEAQMRHESLSQYVRTLYYSKSEPQSSSYSNTVISEALKNVTSARSEVVLIGLCIINLGSEVLIVRRAEKDIDVPNLDWAFPGGTIRSIDISKEVQSTLVEVTNIGVELFPMATRIIPDSANINKQIVALYFAGEVVTREVILSKKYSEYMWVNARDIHKYFTSSVSDQVTAHLVGL